ncbi:hypothetical protein Dip518_001334 [Parelusimicrobium proximum]
MKKLLLLSLIFLLALGCSKKQTIEEEPYNRTGSRQEQENIFRHKVFAAYGSEGRFYATYGLAKLSSQTPDMEGKYTVTFTNGPLKDKTVKTKDVIFKTEAVSPVELEKGMVVLRNFWNPSYAAKGPHDRWNKAVVYDVSKKSEGKVVIEFPRDRNDFMATRETVWIHSIRLITDPVTKDPRKFLN